MAYDHGKDLFVLRDGEAKMWGVSAEKIRPWKELPLTSEWQIVPPGMSVPSGAEYKIDVGSGQSMARLQPASDL